jgi:hypothetical protein
VTALAQSVTTKPKPKAMASDAISTKRACYFA